MSSSKATVSFFGATGGCALHALVLSLNASYYCRALARTPSKLTTLLLAAGVKQETIDKYLFIQAGDIRDHAAVRAVLETSEKRVTPLIISGIGMLISLSPGAPPIDKTICADTVDSFTNVLKEIQPAQKPVVCVISSTGIEDKTRDIPIAFVPMYRLFLGTPHADKKRMEQNVEAGLQGGFFSSTVVVRPSLLTDGAEKGESGVRVSWKGDGGKTAIGYTISRKDVGGWIFRNVIEGDNKWNGRVVTLTY